jgi:hypothetical protein
VERGVALCVPPAKAVLWSHLAALGLEEWKARRAGEERVEGSGQERARRAVGIEGSTRVLPA